MFVYLKVNLSQFSTYMLGTVYHSLIFYTQTSIYTFLFNLGIIMPQTLLLTMHIFKHILYHYRGLLCTSPLHEAYSKPHIVFRIRRHLHFTPGSYDWCSLWFQTGRFRFRMPLNRFLFMYVSGLLLYSCSFRWSITDLYRDWCRSYVFTIPLVLNTIRWSYNTVSVI